MTRMIFSLLFLGLWLSGCAQKNEKPNILIIWTDQQRASTMAAYGNMEYDVPNMNKLSEQSFVFQNAYVSQPVCTASRSTVITGQYPHTTGCSANNIPLPEEAISLPEMVEHMGYRTAYMGKWHLGDEIFPQQGFDEWVGIEDFYKEYYSEGKDRNARSGYHKFLVEHGIQPDDTINNVFTRPFAASLPFKLSKTNYLAQESIKFLEKNKNHPFLIHLNFLEPHSPFTGPFDDYYHPGGLSMPESFSRHFEEHDPKKIKVMHEGFKRYRAKWERINANYAGLVKQVDLSLGMILDKLEDLGLDKNTIIVYTSDHGEMMGAHGMFHKAVMFEDALKVPFMIYNPFLDKPKKNIVKGRVSNVDLVPTILEMIGVDPATQPQLQGKSLVREMKAGKIDNNPVFSEWNPNYLKEPHKRLNTKKNNLSKNEMERLAGQYIRTVITQDGWKLNWSDKDNSQLFNLNADPNELNNLYEEPEYKEKIIVLKKLIMDWQEMSNDIVRLKI